MRKYIYSDVHVQLKYNEMKMQQILDTIYFNTYEYRPSEAIDTKKYELSMLLNHYASLVIINQELMDEIEFRLKEKNARTNTKD